MGYLPIVHHTLALSPTIIFEFTSITRAFLKHEFKESLAYYKKICALKTDESTVTFWIGQLSAIAIKVQKQLSQKNVVIGHVPVVH